MTEPLRVYSTETPGLYRTEDGRKASRLQAIPGSFSWCVRCTQPLNTGLRTHWVIGDAFYCERCVQIVSQGQLL